VTSAGGTSYDGMIGSVGGGNHFAEVQYVASVSDARAAYAWGLRPGRVVTMVHSGSLALGHAANRIAADLTRSLWPDGLAHPVNGLWPLPLDEASAPARARWAGAASPGVRPENVRGAAAARRSWTRSCGSSGS
jgi:tRNA-splicing ligase RtcB (3'-phosphate/5'-hydroxy nucleic acid ligase)